MWAISYNIPNYHPTMTICLISMPSVSLIEGGLDWKLAVNPWNEGSIFRLEFQWLSKHLRTKLQTRNQPFLRLMFDGIKWSVFRLIWTKSNRQFSVFITFQFISNYSFVDIISRILFAISIKLFVFYDVVQDSTSSWTYFIFVIPKCAWRS